MIEQSTRQRYRLHVERFLLDTYPACPTSRQVMVPRQQQRISGDTWTLLAFTSINKIDFAWCCSWQVFPAVVPMCVPAVNFSGLELGPLSGS